MFIAYPYPYNLSVSQISMSFVCLIKHKEPPQDLVSSIYSRSHIGWSRISVPSHRYELYFGFEAATNGTENIGLLVLHSRILCNAIRVCRFALSPRGRHYCPMAHGLWHIVVISAI